MITQYTYTIVSVIALIAIIFIFVMVHKNIKFQKITPLAGIAFVCIISGVIFGDDGWIGYGLIGIGVLLSAIDIVIKSKQI